MTTEKTCGYLVIERDGTVAGLSNEQPCGQPCTGWRYYTDCGHEPVLQRTCDEHSQHWLTKGIEAIQAIERAGVES